jgi:hypothetical protein
MAPRKPRKQLAAAPPRLDKNARFGLPPVRSLRNLPNIRPSRHR